MPLPDRLARFNRVATNRVARLVSGWVPPLATVVHVGRRSGNVYRTPVLAFRTGDTWAFALTYGPDRDWVRNVLAAGRFEIERAGRLIRLGGARRLDGEAGRALVAPYVRPVLARLGVDQFLAAEER